jgi:vitamin B12 transporter
MSRKPVNHLQILFSIIIILLIGVIPAFAGESDSDDQTVDIGEIVVEADAVNEGQIPRKPTSFGRIIDLRKLIRRFADLKDILRSEPGIYTREFSGSGHVSTINIRGTSAKGVLVMIDGTPMNSLWSTGVNLSSLPLNSFEKVEVLRGGGGAFYGDCALGGAVNLITPDSETSINNVSFTIGSFNLFENRSMLGFRDSKGKLLIATQGVSSKGNFPFNNDNGTVFDISDDYPDDRANNEVDSFGLLFKYSGIPQNEGEFSIVGEFYSSREGVAGLTTFPTLNARQKDDRVFIQTEMSKDGIGKNLDGRFRFYYRTEGLDYEDKSGESTGSPIDTYQRGDLFGMASGFTKYDADGQGLSSGAFEVSHEIYHQKSSPDRGRSKSAISLEREQNFGRDSSTMHVASRLDMIEGFDPRLSSKAGYSYHQNEHTEWRANIGNSFRVPGFDELYENRGLVIGNANLVPEKGIDFDIGFVDKTDDYSVGLTFFHNRLRDQIVYELISGFRYKPFNVGKTDLTGIEFSAFRNIGDIDFTMNYTWLDARNRTDDPATRNRKLPSRPEHELFAQIATDIDPFDLEFDYHYTSGNYTTFSNMMELKDRSRLDFRLTWEKSPDFILTAEIRNMLDRDLTDIRGFPLPRRGFYLTVSRDF